jgi:hypothetical protein
MKCLLILFRGYKVGWLVCWGGRVMEWIDKEVESYIPTHNFNTNIFQNSKKIKWMPYFFSK